MHNTPSILAKTFALAIGVLALVADPPVYSQVVFNLGGSHGFNDSTVALDQRTSFNFGRRQAPAPARNAGSPAPHVPWNADSFETFIDDCEQTGIPYKLSLKELAQACRKAEKQNGRLPSELRYVHRFTCFFGFLVDRDGGDVILLGIKDSKRPPIDIDCLVTAMKAVYGGQTPVCSLDKHEDPKWQKTRVEGVAWNTRWAEIMVEADYLMKRICQGKVDPHIAEFDSWVGKTVNNYRQSGKFESQYNRWWFNRPKEVTRRTLLLDDRGDLTLIYKNPVVLLTEQEIDGKFGTGTVAKEAEQFARAFTQNMELLAQRYQSIGELLTLYRLLDMMVHLKEITGVMPPDDEYWFRQYEASYQGPPAVFPSLTRDINNIRLGAGRIGSLSIVGGVEMPHSLNKRVVDRDIRPQLKPRIMAHQ